MLITLKIIFSPSRMLMEKSSGVELELKQMDINFDQLRQSTCFIFINFLHIGFFCIHISYLHLFRQSTENKIHMNLQTIANNNKQSQANAESIKRYFFFNERYLFQKVILFRFNLK